MHFISSRVESVDVEKPDGSVVTYPVGFIETQMDFYSATGKTVKTWNISGMFIVLWPITVKIKTRELAMKPACDLV